MKLKLFTPVLLLSLTAFGANAIETVQIGEQTARAHKVKSKSARSEAIAVRFYNKIFNERADVERTAKRFMKADYIQHNAFVGTGRENFITGIGNLLASNPDLKFEIKHVVTDGDLVVLFVHVHVPGSGEPGEAIMEMLRIEDGKIAEHWDVQQPIPASIPHDNGMF